MPDDAGKMAAADLYEADFAVWAESQAAALLARRPDMLDWDNLADEVEGLAKTELRSCLSFTALIIEHLLKLQFVNSPRDHDHWFSELGTFRLQLEDTLTPTLERLTLERFPPLFMRHLTRLAGRGLLSKEAVLAVLPEGYTWSQIRDDLFFPTLSEH